MAKSKSVLPSKASATKREKHWDDPHFQERAPGLYEFLSAALLDGEERKGGSVTLFCSNGALKVCFTTGRLCSRSTLSWMGQESYTLSLRKSCRATMSRGAPASTIRGKCRSSLTNGTPCAIG